RGRGSRSVLLSLLQLFLGQRHIGVGGLEDAAVGVQLLLQAGKLLLRAAYFGLRAGRTRVQFGATLFIGAATRDGSIDFHHDCVQSLAVLIAFALDGITALGALAVLGFHRADGLT